MLKEVTATGRTVDEAIDEGCKELGIDRADAKFEILTLPKKGFLGLKVIPAKVRVYQEMSKADLAVQYITSILREMGVSDFKTSVKVEDDTAYITLTGDNMGIIIGRRGETLDAKMCIRDRAWARYSLVALATEALSRSKMPTISSV